MNKIKLSERAEKWLKSHNLLNKVTVIKEYSNKIEFTEPTKRVGFVKLNTVCLLNNYWEAHTVHKSALREDLW